LALAYTETLRLLPFRTPSLVGRAPPGIALHGARCSAIMGKLVR
jgi:hypothetical protein